MWAYLYLFTTTEFTRLTVSLSFSLNSHCFELIYMGALLNGATSRQTYHRLNRPQVENVLNVFTLLSIIVLYYIVYQGLSAVYPHNDMADWELCRV